MIGQPISGFFFETQRGREAEEQRENQREISLTLSAPPFLCVSKKNPLDSQLVGGGFTVRIGK